MFYNPNEFLDDQPTVPELWRSAFSVGINFGGTMGRAPGNFIGGKAFMIVRQQL